MPSYWNLKRNTDRYKIFQDELADEFLDKNSNNKKLVRRIKEKIVRISIDPHREAEKAFISSKCPKCKRARVGDYRIIYFIYDSKNAVQILDIGKRATIYKKWG